METENWHRECQSRASSVWLELADYGEGVETESIDSSSTEFCCKREQKHGTVASVLRSRKSVWRWDILSAVSIVIGMTHRNGF